MKRGWRRWLLFVALCAVALWLWAFELEPRRLVTHEIRLDLPRWPREFSGLRVALLSDLHVGSRHWGVERLPELVARTNAAQPDLIVLAGDYISHNRFGEQVEPEAIALGLSGFRAPLGVVLVLGNHDVWFDASRVTQAFEAYGMRVLENQAVVLRFRDRELCVVGLADQMTRPQRVRATFDALSTGATIIAVVHEPDVFVEIDERVALTLAGHTHGGQVNLPLLGRLLVPSLYGERFAAGHIVENGRHLFVTTGVGTSILPLRFRVPPEIALLTLR
ncbi:MAG: metallophosphoesterase [Myxococcota bacterium]